MSVNRSRRRCRRDLAAGRDLILGSCRSFDQAPTGHVMVRRSTGATSSPSTSRSPAGPTAILMSGGRAATVSRQDSGGADYAAAAAKSRVGVRAGERLTLCGFAVEFAQRGAGSPRRPTIRAECPACRTSRWLSMAYEATWLPLPRLSVAVFLAARDLGELRPPADHNSPRSSGNPRKPVCERPVPVQNVGTKPVLSHVAEGHPLSGTRSRMAVRRSTMWKRADEVPRKRRSELQSATKRNEVLVVVRGRLQRRLTASRSRHPSVAAWGC
jgi:hypothetical protein